MTDSSEPVFANPHQRLAEELMAGASRDQLIQCARVLALNVANYERRFGVYLLDQTMQMAASDTARPETARLWSHGMQTLSELLKQIASEADSPGSST